MFTGLIETVGTVIRVDRRSDYRVMTIESSIPCEQLVIGESIACDGVCLTLVAIDATSFAVEVSAETATRVPAEFFQTGRKLNLERALKMGDRLGGHFVTGHIDCTGTVATSKRVGKSLILEVTFDPVHDCYVVEKGSIAINGVSLTVNSCHQGQLAVNLIPHTAAMTNLTDLSQGDKINLEFDLIGKYALKKKTSVANGGLNLDTLRSSGW